MGKGPTYLGLSGKPLGIVITSILTFGFVLVGYDQGVMSGVIATPLWIDNFPAVRNNATLLGFVVAIYDIGCLLGALTCMCFGDRFGRKKSCISGGLSVIIGVTIQVTAFRKVSETNGALAQFLIGRVLTGMGNGINMASMPVYQAEVSNNARGFLVCLECGLIATGTMLSYWVNYGVRNYTTSFTWRFPISFQIVLSLIYVIGMLFMPESPRWLCKTDQSAEATKVMAALNGETEDSPETVDNIRGIMDSVQIEEAIGKAFHFRDLLTGGPTQHFRRVVLGISSQFFQQVGGCNAIIYYVPILFQKSFGMTNEQSLLLGGVNMIVYAVFSLVSFWTVEWLGRRKLFLIGTIGQMVSMIITFGCLIPGTKQAGNGAALGIFLYIAFFGATYLTVPWLYAAEINPLRNRAKGAALANIVNWSMNFLIVMITPIMVANIGWGTYIFFAAVNACFIPFIYFFYPETAHRSLEEIDMIFAKGFSENMSYVKASKELPKLSVEDIERLACQYGLTEAFNKSLDDDVEKSGNIQVENTSQKSSM